MSAWRKVLPVRCNGVGGEEALAGVRSWALAAGAVAALRVAADAAHQESCCSATPPSKRHRRAPEWCRGRPALEVGTGCVIAAHCRSFLNRAWIRCRGECCISGSGGSRGLLPLSRASCWQRRKPPSHRSASEMNHFVRGTRRFFVERGGKANPSGLLAAQQSGHGICARLVAVGQPRTVLPNEALDSWQPPRQRRIEERRVSVL